MKLKEAIYKLPFDKILTLKNVRNTINEADGYQPHIIAPEAGYRRLIEDGLTLLREPCARPSFGGGLGRRAFLGGGLLVRTAMLSREHGVATRRERTPSARRRPPGPGGLAP